MITTRRREQTNERFFNFDEKFENVEQKARTVSAIREYDLSEDVIKDENEAAQAFNRNIGRNFENLLNLGNRRAEIEEETINQKIREQACEEDLTPSSTTMQFGEEDYMEVSQQMKEEKKVKNFKLSGRAKLLVILYGIITITVFALIVLNTKVLSELKKEKQAKASAAVEYVAETEAESEIKYKEILSL